MQPWTGACTIIILQSLRLILFNTSSSQAAILVLPETQTLRVKKNQSLIASELQLARLEVHVPLQRVLNAVQQLAGTCLQLARVEVDIVVES